MAAFVCACIAAYICMVSGQREVGKLSFYAFLQFRVTSTAAKLITSDVMLFLKYNSVLNPHRIKGKKRKKKRRLIGLVEVKLLLLSSANMKLFP